MCVCGGSNAQWLINLTFNGECYNRLISRSQRDMLDMPVVIFS